MSIRAVLAATALGGILLSSSGAHAASIYDAGAGLTGNQGWGGTLGLDFTVNSNVSVHSLGAFDSGGNTISSHIFTTIFNAGGVAVTPTVDFYGATASGSAYVSQSISNVTLTPGQYQIASWGYGASDPNFNTYGANPGPVSFDTLGGSLTALGSHYSTSAGGIATLDDVGSTRYAAGTFGASAIGPPPPPPVPGPLGPGVYNAPGGLIGNQTWSGTLGMDFTVTRAISIRALGAFDSGGNGITGDVRGVIFDAQGAPVTQVLDFKGAVGTGAAYVFKSLDGRVILTPGEYQLATWGYSNADSNYNTYGSNPGPVTFDSLGGALVADGTRYSMPGGAGSLATIQDNGLTRYGAGSFLGGAVPEPASWAMMLVGFGGLGAVLRRRRRAVFAAA